MYTLRSFLTLVLLLCVLIPQTLQNENVRGVSNCTGGSIYFSAHPVDSLLFQNPDLLHDLYVFKCTTSVVFTSGNRGISGNYSKLMERGLENAHAFMAGISMDELNRTETKVRFGEREVQLWTPQGAANIQIIFLRLPDSTPRGNGFDSNDGDTLQALYTEEKKNITTSDGSATYTLDSLKDTIATILRKKQPRKVHILNPKAAMPRRRGVLTDHVDHIIMSKLVVDVIDKEKSEAEVQAYAGNSVLRLEANLNPTQRAFARKAAAFFKYAEHDPYMCHSLDECADWSMHGMGIDDDAKYVSKYLEREYHVSGLN